MTVDRFGIISTTTRASGFARCHSLSHVNSWSPAANYVPLQDERGKFTGKSLVIKHLMKRRVGIWTCATIEEVEVGSGRANPAMLDRVEVAIKSIRRDAIKAYEKLEKEKKLSEDNVKDLSSDLQKLIDKHMKKI